MGNGGGVQIICMHHRILLAFSIVDYILQKKVSWDIAKKSFLQLFHVHELVKSFSKYTGSAIRNWYNVKTWLDQMFWQIYQKLMLSGFLSSGNLCLIHHLKLFLTSHGLNGLCQRTLRLREVKKVSNGGSGINFHYSERHWASVFGRFVKPSGQARSLLYVNS